MDRLPSEPIPNPHVPQTEGSQIAGHRLSNHVGSSSGLIVGTLLFIDDVSRGFYHLKSQGIVAFLGCRCYSTGGLFRSLCCLSAALFCGQTVQDRLIVRIEIE